MNAGQSGKTGKVEVRDGRVLFEGPNLVKGLMQAQGFPSEDFEVSIEAIRHEPVSSPGDQDAFLSITFPIGKALWQKFDGCLSQAGDSSFRR